jgi:hypothetical protein
MSNGIFSRLNATQVQNSGMGDGMIISVIGSMESTDGTTMSLRTSDGTSLQYAMPAEFDFVQVSNFMHSYSCSCPSVLGLAINCVVPLGTTTGTDTGLYMYIRKN